MSLVFVDIKLREHYGAVNYFAHFMSLPCVSEPTLSRLASHKILFLGFAGSTQVTALPDRQMKEQITMGGQPTYAQTTCTDFCLLPIMRGRLGNALICCLSSTHIARKCCNSTKTPQTDSLVSRRLLP